MLILLQFCMVRNLLLTFHFWQCLGLVHTCLVLSWCSLHAKIALLCLIFNLFCALFSMEMTFLKYSEVASPFFTANHISICQVIDWCLHVHLSFYHFQLMSSYLIAEIFFFSSQEHGLALCTVNRNGIKFSPALTTSISDTLSLSVLAVLLYFLSLTDVSISYSKVFNKNIK